MVLKPDNITAIATAPGRGGIGVVRVSGRNLVSLAKSITGKNLSPRLATYTSFIAMNGEVIDQGIAIYFPSPHSYTGEEVLELQGHGGAAVLQLVLQRCIELGARIAQPGEFTQRAFLNNKIDLAQAESVADLIEATTQQAAKSAIRSLSGEFSAAINGVLAKLIDLRMLVEATLDFPEEEGVGAAEHGRIKSKLDLINEALEKISALAKQGSILRDGAQVVLVGAPNVGKSSLLNRLAGEEVALVSEVAGTTRDAIRQALQINGVPLHVIDTAGLRETDDVVERMGIARTQQNIERADVVMVLIDSSDVSPQETNLLNQIPKSIPKLFVHTKIDLPPPNNHNFMSRRVDGHLYISSKTGDGMEELKSTLLKLIGWHQEEGVFVARKRHLVAIAQAQEHLMLASEQLTILELFAEELRLAQMALNQVTGEFVADDLLGEIFSRFCIGK